MRSLAHLVVVASVWWLLVAAGGDNATAAVCAEATTCVDCYELYLSGEPCGFYLWRSQEHGVISGCVPGSTAGPLEDVGATRNATVYFQYGFCCAPAEPIGCSGCVAHPQCVYNLAQGTCGDRLTHVLGKRSCDSTLEVAMGSSTARYMSLGEVAYFHLTLDMATSNIFVDSGSSDIALFASRYVAHPDAGSNEFASTPPKTVMTLADVHDPVPFYITAVCNTISCMLNLSISYEDWQNLTPNPATPKSDDTFGIVTYLVFTVGSLAVMSGCALICEHVYARRRRNEWNGDEGGTPFPMGGIPAQPSGAFLIARLPPEPSSPQSSPQKPAPTTGPVVFLGPADIERMRFALAAGGSANQLVPGRTSPAELNGVYTTSTHDATDSAHPDLIPPTPTFKGSRGRLSRKVATALVARMEQMWIGLPLPLAAHDLPTNNDDHVSVADAISLAEPLSRSREHEVDDEADVAHSNDDRSTAVVASHASRDRSEYDPAVEDSDALDISDPIGPLDELEAIQAPRLVTPDDEIGAGRLMWQRSSSRPLAISAPLT